MFISDELQVDLVHSEKLTALRLGSQAQTEVAG